MSGKRNYRPTKMVKSKETGRYIQKAIPDKEVRATIMKAFDLKDKASYKKFYDLNKNKIYAYNQFMGKDKIKSTQTYLYAIAKSKLKYGDDYRPSQQTRLVSSMSAYSKTAGRKAYENKSGRSYKSQQAKFNESIERSMGNFLKVHRGGNSIVDQIESKYADDPAKKLEALSKYADSLKTTKRDDEGNVVSNDNTFPLGSTAGSTEASAFEYDGETFINNQE